MNRISLSRLLLPALLLVGLIGPLGAASAETAEAALADHARHGYSSPLAALQRLQAAEPLPANAPLELRRDYLAALARHAIDTRDDAATDRALTQLQAMAKKEDCAPCALLVLLRQTHRAIEKGDADKVRARLLEIAAYPPATDPRLQFETVAIQSLGRDLLGDYTAATQFAAEAVQLADRHESAANRVYARHLLVRAHLGKGDMEAGLKIAEQALAQAERIGFVYLQVLVRGNQGFAYAELGEHKQQHLALTEALRRSRGVPGLTRATYVNQINLSDYHAAQGEYPQALQYAADAEALADQMRDPARRALALSYRGGAMVRLGQPDAGLDLMREAVAIAEKAGAQVEAINLLDRQIAELEHLDRSKEALSSLRRLIEMSDEMTRRQREQAVQELQHRYSAERKSREIDQLSLENARKQAEVEARDSQQRLWAAMAVILFMAALLLAQWLRRVRQRNRRLETDHAVLSEQSSLDPLTGAFNRRHCQRLMSQQEATLHGRSRDRNYTASVGLLLLDVDFFKKVNDQYGHAAGDAVLVEVSRRLQGLLREKDAVVRWGGEEFVLVLPGTPADGLQVVAERVLSAIGSRPVDAEGRAIPVTASAGCVAWPAYPGQHWEDALHLADLALYLSKSTGRNRATCLSSVSEAADLDRVRNDLAAAQAAGDVGLEVVVGPGRDQAALAAAGG